MLLLNGIAGGNKKDYYGTKKKGYVQIVTDKGYMFYLMNMLFHIIVQVVMDLDTSQIGQEQLATNTPQSISLNH